MSHPNMFRIFRSKYHIAEKNYTEYERKTRNILSTTVRLENLYKDLRPLSHEKPREWM